MEKQKKEFVPISEASTKKKISFFSAMFIAMGSCIGAGIFLKSKSVLESSGSSLVLAIICWIVAAFAVMAMALALIEISSARNDNLSLIGWCKTFNTRFIAKASKNFMFYIYLPLTYFFMPLYVVMSLQDAWSNFALGAAPVLDTSVDWIIWTLVSLAISVYFIIISGWSSKAGDAHNKVILMFKFIPLVFAALIGFILLGSGAKSTAHAGVEINSSILKGDGLASMTPGIGIFMAIGAIFFAYDGFYVTAGLQSEMKEPKKTSLAILLGLGVVTAIYLIIAISMSIVGNGSILGLHDAMVNGAGWNSDTSFYILGVINLMIAIGILGIVNGFAMWAPRFVEDLIREGEVPFSEKYVNQLNPNKPKVGIMISLVISIPVVLVFTIIGALTYMDTGDYGFYGSGMGPLYSFADLMANWTAVFAFGFIMFPIFGGLKNRKTNAIKVEKNKWFVPAAWTSVIIVGIALFLQVLLPIFDLLLLAAVDKNVMFADVQLANINDHKDWVEAGSDMSNEVKLLTETQIWDKVNTSFNNTVLSRVMLIVVLFIFLGLMTIPTIFEDKNNIKKYGSLEAAEKHFQALAQQA